MKFKICHLYPDLLNLYGDNGNVVCLKKRLEWRGIDCEITSLKNGETTDFTQYDMFFIGGGQGFEQDVLLEDLKKGKDKEIISAVEDEKVFLSICTGFQLMGQYYKAPDGTQTDFIGALDFHTIGDKERMTGNYMFRCGSESGGSVVVGFENHDGRTYLGDGLKPLGEVISGNGNNGKDKGEGVRYKNVFGTYCHGPLLPKNPKLADFILETAIRRRIPDFKLEPIDDRLENIAHDYMEHRLSNN